MLARVIVLGPQRHVPMVRPAVEFLVPGHDGERVAAITAGWEERELEDQELRDHLQRPMVNLELWGRVEQIFMRDTELLQAMRNRHDILRKVQDLYRLRLVGLMESTRALLKRIGDAALLEPEREGSIAMLQELDRAHVERVGAIHSEFEDQWRPSERSAVQEQRRELQALLADAPCVLIAGGHVGMLLHRLRLFDVPDLIQKKPVVAWSAGAMCLCERIVLFHDDPPQGGADAEVMEAGFGLVRGVIPLPHARRRLNLQDPRNVQLMARRFAPDFCAVLDDGTRLDWNGTRWSAPQGTRKLTAAGRLQEVGA